MVQRLAFALLAISKQLSRNGKELCNENDFVGTNGANDFSPVELLRDRGEL